jgi:RNA polymerase sigma-70 factor (ECF subfamily)
MTGPDLPHISPPAPAADHTDADPRWREWYEAHSAAVYGYVRFHVASPDEAEDLTAETFFRALRASDRFDADRASVKTWILAIARNAVRDHQRRSLVRRHVPLASMRDLVSDHPSPEERLLWEEEVCRIMTALDRLPAGDREIISLRYGSELEPAEVAAALGLRESTARTRLWRALGRLREALQD